MMVGEREVVAMIDGLTLGQLKQWIRQGWVRPVTAADSREFSEIDIARVRLIHHLRRDLQININAVPIILSLMDQVYGLRHELRSFARACDRQSVEIRADIAIEVRRERASGKAE
jgi:chaperone modulatory protein CbpM